MGERYGALTPPADAVHEGPSAAMPHVGPMHTVLERK